MIIVIYQNEPLATEKLEGRSSTVLKLIYQFHQKKIPTKIYFFLNSKTDFNSVQASLYGWFFTVIFKFFGTFINL